VSSLPRHLGENLCDNEEFDSGLASA
jgi:hypothetical protein